MTEPNDIQFPTTTPTTEAPKEALVYEQLTLDQTSNPKCQIIKANNMACGKNAVAHVVSTPGNFMVETANCDICQYHLNIIISSGAAYGYDVKEQNNGNSPNYASTVSNSKQQPDPTA